MKRKQIDILPPTSENFIPSLYFYINETGILAKEIIFQFVKCIKISEIYLYVPNLSKIYSADFEMYPIILTNKVRYIYILKKFW